ncbi:MAG TPA: NAD(P)-dependent oxidoreductase [Micromonosporaceae bacterium]|nr:NAD(P)-dependent oxidoreductase [Micromonosporaceae bacterium]
MADVAILGTGRMGSAMARRVAGAGHRLAVWNRTEATARVVADGIPGVVSVASTPAAAVRNKDVVLTVLADGDATRTTVLDRGVLTALTPGTVLCDLGTSGPSVATDLARGLADAQVRFLDAPVSGSVPAVEAGTLLVMAGGDADAVAVARPVLAAFARTVLHVGPAGAGQTMKLAVNLVVHDLNSAVAEALVIATSAGIDAAAAYDVFEESVIAAPFVHYKRAAFLEPDGPVAMSLDLVGKDLRLIVALADELRVPVRMTEANAASVAAACRAGYGPRDMASLSRFLTAHRDSV